MKKRSRHIPKGMVKDVSASKLGQDYYIDALNIKITPTDNNTGYSITNIKSNAMVGYFAGWNYVGHIVLNQYLVLFLTNRSNGEDSIIRINTNDITVPKSTLDVLKVEYTEIANGDFNFNIDYPIEGIGIYEKEDVQKVYWVDGLNQPRYLNIVRKEKATESYQLDFVKTLSLDENVTITRNETTIGNISAGTMQYAFTYYNIYGAESNIVYLSPLYYIAYTNRGASAEDTTVSTSFSIIVQNLDITHFKNGYLRIYSIHRSSINDTPEVRRVADLKVPDTDKEDNVIAFVDDGTLGEIVDPTLLLYVGGKSIIPNTMEQKDATLFFGNYKEPNSLIAQDETTRTDIKTLARQQDISFGTKEVNGSDFKGYYNYNNQLTKSQQEIACYKYGETYRFGFQAQKSTGEWSEPIFINDAENTQPIQMLDSTWGYFGESQQFNTNSNNGFKTAVPTTTLGTQLVDKLKAEGYVQVRPLVVFPTQTDRTVICQGVLCPTVFNVGDRISNAPYSQSSWFFRPNAPINQDAVVMGENESTEDTDSSDDNSAITYENGGWYEIITSAEGINSETLANCVGGTLKFSVTSTKGKTYSVEAAIKGYILSQDGNYIAWFTDTSSAYLKYLAIEENFPIDGTVAPTILVEVIPNDSSSSDEDSSSSSEGVTFDFTNPTSLNPSITPATTDGDWVNANEYTFKSSDEKVVLTFSNAAANIKTSVSTNITTGLEETTYYLRMSSYSRMKIQGIGNTVLEKIEMTGNCASLSLRDGEPGYMDPERTGELWEHNTDNNVKSVEFEAGNTNANILTITVTYKDSNSSTDTDSGSSSTESFNYDYNYFNNLKDYNAEGAYTPSYLNNWVIYNTEFDDMCPNASKVVQLVNGNDFSKVIRTGYMTETNVNGYPGVEVQWTNGDSDNLTDGSISDGIYTLIFPAGTWGDSYYRKYLSNSSSVSASLCHVNPQMKLTFQVSSSSTNNSDSGLSSVTFDLFDPASLNPSITPSENDGEGISIDNTVFTAMNGNNGATLGIYHSDTECYLYTHIDSETGEVTYSINMPAGSKMTVHSIGDIYARRIDVVNADTGKTSTVWESNANVKLLYTHIDNFTTEQNIKSVVFYYKEISSTSSKTSSEDWEDAETEEQESASSKTSIDTYTTGEVAGESAELAVYNGSSSGVYAAVFSIDKMPKIYTRSGKLIWNAGIYNKDYYVITSRYLRTMLSPESSLVTIQLLADTSLSGNDESSVLSNKYVTGSSTEFRHWHQIPNANHANAEIQCNYVSSYNLDQNDSYVNAYSNFLEQTLSVDLNNEYEIKYFPKQTMVETSSETVKSLFNGVSPTYTTTVKLTKQNFKDSFSDMYFIDQSILTFHSPDIEFDTTTHSINESSLKLRLVGYVPITSTISDVDIQASTVALNYWDEATTAPGFIHETIGSIGQKGWRGLNTDSLWWDEEWYTDIDELKRSNHALFTTGYLTYPWHRSGSLNNQPAQTYTGSDSNDNDKSVSSANGNVYRSATLQRKVMSNLRYSFNTVYCYKDSSGAIQPMTTKLSSFNTQLPDGNNLSAIALFDTDQVLNTRLLVQDDSGDTFNYYGNIDKLLASSRKFFLNWDGSNDITTMGYPIFRGKRDILPSKLSISQYGEDNIRIVTDCAYDQSYDKPDKVWVRTVKLNGECKSYQFGTDPVLMKYKTTPHAVLSLRYINDNTVHILPTGTDETGSSRVYIVPDVRTVSEVQLDEANSNFVCPANTVMTGRQHTGDEHGRTYYEYATLKAVDSSGNCLNLTITVEEPQWSGNIKESAGTEFKAPSGRVIVGRKHTGDENGNTEYKTAIIKVNGKGTTITEEITSAKIKESSDTWFKTDDQRVMIGRCHSGDENGDTYYISAKVLYTAEKGEVSTSTVAINKIDYEGITPFWDDTKSLSVQQETVYVQPKYGYLWMGELVNTKHSMNSKGELVDDDSSDAVCSVRFGGTSESAIQNNTWLIAGKSTSLDAPTLEWTQGDTYYQRYDCLKTYPYTQDDTNSIVDICSFMVETRVNIDGRYDRNRGQTSNLQMTPQIFNLLNPVYSQLNNYFSYKVLDANLFNTDTYRNYITWSKSKTYGEEVDTWTNVTLANVLDMDGNKGDVRCLKLFNNTLLCLQDKAISQILYNEQVQISTEQGVPVEISNSDKVQGKRYLTNTIGCCDKWTVKSTPFGLFFMDYLDPAIYVYTGQQFTNLTESLGMSSWAKNNIGYSKKKKYDSEWSKLKTWKPYSFREFINNKGGNRCFRTHFDPLTNNVYFIGTDCDANDCLVFSTQLQQFICFQSLGASQMLEAVQDKTFLWYYDNNLYMQEAGTDYGRFCNNYWPYYITYIENQDPMTDKTFSTLDFRATVDGEGSYDKDGKFSFTLPFDTLTVWNDYQSGKAKLGQKNGHSAFLHHTSNMAGALKRKFRMWHCDIPRDNVGKITGSNGKTITHPLDRMRSPWMYFKLQGQAKQQMELHDMIIDYFE